VQATGESQSIAKSGQCQTRPEKNPKFWHLLFGHEFQQPLEFLWISEGNHNSTGSFAVGVDHHLRAKSPSEFVFQRNDLARSP